MKRALYWLIALMLACQAASVAADMEDLERNFGLKGYSQADVMKFSFPRSDLKVTVGEVPVEPGFALTSWAAFMPMRGESMVMGDMVLISAEVMPVIKKCQMSGIEITALHNHLIGSSPSIWYMHFSGHGDAARLAASLKSVLAETATPLKATPSTDSLQVAPAWVTIEDILARKGQRRGNLLQFSVPRNEKIMQDGIEILPSMGVANAINFELLNNKAATTGDFVLLAKEVNPVIKALTNHGIQVTAIHNHMLSESPRLFFLHFWGYDSPKNLAEGITAALDQVNVKK